jgi:hypothetical protein
MAAQYEPPTVLEAQDVELPDHKADHEVSEGGDWPPQHSDPAGAGSSADQSRWKPDPSEKSAANEVVYLKDAVGRKFTFPFKLARTWHVGLVISDQRLHDADGGYREWRSWCFRPHCMSIL